MELALNLAWAALAFSATAIWFRAATIRGQQRRTEFVALAMCLLILFPVISVTDDLQMPLNPAEADCCVRRDFAAPDTHSMLPFVALPEPSFSGLSTGSPRHAGLGAAPAAPFDLPGLLVIQNRPPPAA